jgi:hypothetical protein
MRPPATNPTSVRRLLAPVACYANGWLDAGLLALDHERAVEMLRASNPRGRHNADVLRPTFTDQDLMGRPRHLWTIAWSFRLREYELPYRHFVERLPGEYARLERRRSEPTNPAALSGFSSDERVRTLEPWATDFGIDPRYLTVAPRSEALVFQWQDCRVVPDHTVVGFARREDYFFGVMQSRVHHLWARAMMSELAPQVRAFRYIPALCFDTFPFPVVSRSQRTAISKAARALDTLRSRWLWPTDLVREETIEFPEGMGTGSYRFLKPIDRAAATALEQQTVQRLYTDWPEWLKDAHRALDAAVLDGYGWNASVTDDEILKGLRASNMARARPRSLSRALRQAVNALDRLAPRGLDRRGRDLEREMACAIDLHALSGLPAHEAIVRGILDRLKPLEEHTPDADVRDGVLHLWLHGRDGREVQVAQTVL